MAARKKKLLVARAMFPAEREGRTVVVLTGTRLSADDPIVRDHAEMFEPDPPQPRRRTRKAAT